MSKEVRVAIIEDGILGEDFEEILKKGGHTVVALVKTRGEANELIPRLTELGVQVVLMDGRLTKDNDEIDGNELTAAINALGSSIQVVDMSLKGNIIVGAHARYGKTRFNTQDSSDLADFVRGL